MSAAAAATDAPYDVGAVRADFPILSREVHGRPLAFLDSAASAQKPRQVIDAVRDVYGREYANVHRGLYHLSERATARYEGARTTVARFIGAAHDREIVFTRNATEAVNLVAASWGEGLEPGDEVVISEMEHHSNIVPWQMLRRRRGVVLRVAPVTDEGELRPDSVARLLGPRTRLIAVAQISNVLGTVAPVADIVRLARAAGARVLVDGAQGAVHAAVDVTALDVDFYVFSGHKLYGPSGIGVLYGKQELLEAMPPYQGGGEMIETVSFEESSWAPLPHKFEAGTPAIAQAVGLAAAVDYVSALGLDRIAAHEAALLDHADRQLAALGGVQVVGTAPGKAGVIAMALDFAHAHDAALIADRAGVAMRAGHHCAQPLMARMGHEALLRASLALYNTRDDIDAMVAALDRVRRTLAGRR